jgi:pyruvate ferredoxin oxidoreductase gamma subunit
MFRVRFHGRGGQGMKTASRILGSALFAEGFEVQDAPRYGAERRGAPIFAYVRADQGPINERGIIRRPDLVVVADETLVPVPAAGVLAGIDAHTLLLIHSRESADTWRERLNTPAQVLILPLSEAVVERAEMPYVGAACAGAAAALLGVVSQASLTQALHSELDALGEVVVQRNLDKALDAFAELAASDVRASEGTEPDAADYASPDWIELPFETAGVSAPVIHAGLTSLASRTGLWRTLRPVIDYTLCNHCWWICSSLCPDGAIRVEDATPAIDYDHCKGCMVCVAVCPPHAITAQPEAAAGERETQS